MRRLAPRAAFPWTICVLFYGDYPELCRRFLGQLYRFTDPAAFHLRAGLNAVSEETHDLIAAASSTYGNVSIYRSDENLYKCPMMRRMIHDPVQKTEWTLWFDDDSYVRHSGWILELALAMEKVKEAELFGSVRAICVSDHLEAFITSARWYQGVPRRRHPEHGGPIILFPIGGFWAVRSKRLTEIHWPDARLTHFEDDYLMGEAMRQQGVKIVSFDSGICIGDAVRRAPSDAPEKLPLIYES